MSKKIGTFVILGLVLLFAVMGYRYLHYRSANAVSDAAFIKSDRLAVLGFKVGGRVVTMTKEENAPVKKGELLARIDAVDFLTAREELRHRMEATIRKIEAAKLQRERLKRSLALRSEIARNEMEAAARQIDATALKIEAAEARLRKLRNDEKRFADLVAKQLVENEKYETVHTERQALARQIDAMHQEMEAQKETLKKAKNALKLSKEEQKRIAELSKEIAAMEEHRDALHSTIEKVSLKISYTELHAPFDGVIAKRFFDAPKVVGKGDPVYALADPKALYCEVLLSEKKMHGVKPGNAVTIEVDAVPGKTYHGEVESIAPSSASTFSLVPRDIASGEFTKLDQRFVVRIALKEIEGLRAGMGATVAISREAGKSLVTGH